LHLRARASAAGSQEALDTNGGAPRDLVTSRTGGRRQAWSVAFAATDGWCNIVGLRRSSERYNETVEWPGSTIRASYTAGACGMRKRPASSVSADTASIVTMRRGNARWVSKSRTVPMTASAPPSTGVIDRPRIRRRRADVIVGRDRSVGSRRRLSISFQARTGVHRAVARSIGFEPQAVR